MDIGHLGLVSTVVFIVIHRQEIWSLNKALGLAGQSLVTGMTVKNNYVGLFNINTKYSGFFVSREETDLAGTELDRDMKMTHNTSI